MWLYVFSAFVGIFLWKIVKYMVSYWKSFREISKAVKNFPLHEDNHWFWGLAHLINDFDSFVKLNQKFIDKIHPVVYITWLMFIRPGVTLVHPRSMKPLLTASHTSAPKAHGWTGVYRLLSPWLGDGLLVSNGKKWERSRRLLTPAFHFDILRPYVAIYNDVADILLRKLEELSCEGKSVNVCPLVSRATLDTMLRCTLSYEDEGIQDAKGEQHPYVSAVNKLKYYVIQRALSPAVFTDFIYYATSNGRDFKRNCDFVHDFSNNLIQKRRETLEKDPSQLEKRHLDFLDILITAKDEHGVGLTDQEIRDEVDTFMFEGHDTTASAIMWALHSLAKYPKMQQRVHEEIEEVLAGRKFLEVDDIPKLHFTSCFLKESMRMYTPVPVVVRSLKEPVAIEGVLFPVGTVIDIHPHLMHHNPAVWENHTNFDPDRFLPENFAKKDPFAFLPFSAGQRNCIGQNFAMNELKVIISRIITRFSISLDEEREAVPYPEVVMSAKDGIYLHFKEL